MISVAVAGATGATGRAVADAIEADPDLDLVARVAPTLAGGGERRYALLREAVEQAGPQVVVDFTRADVALQHAELAARAGVPAVIGTSGLDDEARERLDRLGREVGVPIFWGPNFALGAVLMMRLALEAARVMPSVEIVELHSNHKLDAPSGTAAVTAERLV